MAETERQKALKAFASAIAKKEGKESETHIGNIREILKVQNEILGSDSLYKRIDIWHQMKKVKG